MALYYEIKESMSCFLACIKYFIFFWNCPPKLYMGSFGRILIPFSDITLTLTLYRIRRHSVWSAWSNGHMVTTTMMMMMSDRPFTFICLTRSRAPTNATDRLCGNRYFARCLTFPSSKPVNRGVRCSDGLYNNGIKWAHQVYSNVAEGLDGCVLGLFHAVALSFM